MVYPAHPARARSFELVALSQRYEGLHADWLVCRATGSYHFLHAFLEVALAIEDASFEHIRRASEFWTGDLWVLQSTVALLTQGDRRTPARPVAPLSRGLAG